LSKKNLLILSNTQKSDLSIGDYLRILSFLPNLKFKNIYFLDNPLLRPLVQEYNFIKIIKNIHEINKNNFFYFNLYEKKKNNFNEFYLDSLLDKKINIKKNMSDIHSKLSIFFKIKNYKIFHPQKKNLKIYNKIFFSCYAPNKWKIKEYPVDKWKELEKLLIKNNNIFPKYQEKNSNLEHFIKDIKESEIVISIVNLGCHIANMFSKKLIMLSGSNYHTESIKEKNQITIFPMTKCKFRPCNLPNGKENCGCMPDISVNEIYENIKKIL
jgi:hypothetical protein